MKTKLLAIAILAMTFTGASASSLKDGRYTVNILTTGDTRGRYFTKPLSGEKDVRGSIMNIGKYVSAVKDTSSAVILIDCGGALDGGAVNFYYANVSPDEEHLYPRIAGYIGYDAFIPAAADSIPVFGKVAKSLKKEKISVLGENDFKIIEKGGVRTAVLGSPLALEKAKKKYPHLVISYVGSKEDEGSLDGIDFVLKKGNFSSARVKDGKCVLCPGTYARDLGHGVATIEVKNGKTISKEFSVNSPKLSGADPEMVKAFEGEYNKIDGFVTKEIGELALDLKAKDVYKGQSDYMNFYHSLALAQKGVDISLSATLSIDGTLSAGPIAYKDIARLYPFGNELIVLRMTGGEVKNFLEASYNSWIQTQPSEDGHTLLLKTTKDFKTGQMKPAFKNSPANFDSGAGIVYTVDVTKPYGERVSISSMADGTSFDSDKWYNVGVTSYRAAGAGGLLNAAGIGKDDIEGRTVSNNGPFRTLMYKWIADKAVIDASLIGNPDVVGSWKFIPEDEAVTGIEKDLELIFAK